MIVFSKGRFLEIYIESNNKLVLYAIDLFFVEVLWNIQKDKIINLGAFKCGQALDKYSNVPKEIKLIHPNEQDTLGIYLRSRARWT